jgi:hypothetical protein
MIKQITELVLTALGVAVPLIAAAATLLARLVRTEKAKRALGGAAALASSLLPLIEKAETLHALGGADKRAYVLGEAKSLSESLGVPFDAAALGAQIDALVALTKSVNRPA